MKKKKNDERDLRVLREIDDAPAKIEIGALLSLEFKTVVAKILAYLQQLTANAKLAEIVAKIGAKKMNGALLSESELKIVAKIGAKILNGALLSESELKIAAKIVDTFVEDTIVDDIYEKTFVDEIFDKIYVEEKIEDQKKIAEIKQQQIELQIGGSPRQLYRRIVAAKIAGYLLQAGYLRLNKVKS